MRALVLAIAVLAAAAAPAQALTIRDVIELTRAGLGDEVLLALIEVDGGVFATDAATLKSLKEAGVSDKVMVALIRSGRERRAEEVALPAPVPVDEAASAGSAPPVVVIEHHDPQIQQVAVPVPVYVPVYTSRPRHREDGETTVDSTYVPFQSGLPAVRPRQEPAAAPVYWGFGGKLRPDAWGQPKPAERDKDKKEDKSDEGDKKRAPKK